MAVKQKFWRLARGPRNKAGRSRFFRRPRDIDDENVEPVPHVSQNRYVPGITSATDEITCLS